VLELVLAAGARLAGAGEFSQRAFLNGRLDLTRAEAIAEMIAARSRRAAELAMAGIDGGLQRRINGLRERLLDQLAAGHDFDVPPSMVEAEFGQIWEQLTQEAQNEENPEEALKEIEAEKDDYRKIAERRVRLGLLLSEIGQANGVVVTAQEMEMLIRQAAQQYREQDRQRFIDYVRSEPLAAAQLRAPLYEDKVVDFLFDKAEVTEREVTREELQAAIEAEEGEGDVKPAKKKAAKAAEGDAEAKPAKKKAAKKADAEGEAEAAEGEGKPAKKKAAAKKTPAEGEDA
jgi:trigger factor